jgi:hypothetical protein
MLKRNAFSLKVALIFILVGVLVTPVFAQSQNNLQIGITKTFGFASGNQIRGTFTLYITGSASIKSVQYLVDNKPLGTASSAPFNLTFQTTDYAIGFHDISAVVTTSDGGTITVAARTFEFATSDQETSTTMRILIPIIAVVVLVLLIGAGAQIFFFRKKFVSLAPGTPRNYGIAGGTICPRCHRPYSLHFWAVRLVVVRFDRCDFCGKWAFVRAYPLDALRAAEQNELATAGTASIPDAKSEEEKLRDLIDKSKYTDQ